MLAGQGRHVDARNRRVVLAGRGWRMLLRTRHFVQHRSHRQVRLAQAQRDFIRTLNQCDDERGVRKAAQTKTSPKQLDLPIARNLFDEVRADSVDSLTEHTQEVPEHALDRLRNR